MGGYWESVKGQRRRKMAWGEGEKRTTEQREGRAKTIGWRLKGCVAGASDGWSV